MGTLSKPYKDEFNYLLVVAVAMATATTYSTKLSITYIKCLSDPRVRQRATAGPLLFLFYFILFPNLWMIKVRPFWRCPALLRSIHNWMAITTKSTPSHLSLSLSLSLSTLLDTHTCIYLEVFTGLSIKGYPTGQQLELELAIASRTLEKRKKKKNLCWAALFVPRALYDDVRDWEMRVSDRDEGASPPVSLSTIAVRDCCCSAVASSSSSSSAVEIWSSIAMLTQLAGQLG